MITEDYVSFETAKLLKEKGFDDIDYECHGWIGRSGKHYSADDTFYDDKELKKAQEDRKDFISLITLQMAMKWLRKVHNIHIAIVPCEVGLGIMDYTYILYKIDTENFIFKNLEIQGRANTGKMSASKTCEAAIRYCLENLI